MKPFIVTGMLIDVHQERIYPAEITVGDKKICSIRELAAGTPVADGFLLPGFVDSHVHIESSMLIPSEFARLAVVHGTVGTVSDPHEIANVCGIAGVEYMIENGKTIPFKFNFGAPSCVPATGFETSGAVLDAAEVTVLLERNEIRYLSEMMNFPGVLSGDEEVLKKIAAAHRLNKPVDGHAPGLKGESARQYIAAGISTDHECFTEAEALGKLKLGMKILIREGSAAKNFEALIGLLGAYPDSMMFCSDDKHPDSLVEGHINLLCVRAHRKGIGLFKILKAACVNPVLHYGLDIGLLKAGDAADFIVIKDPVQFEVLKTFIGGELVAENGLSLIGGPHSGRKSTAPINNFSCTRKAAADFTFSVSPEHPAGKALPVIVALDGQLITEKIYALLPVIENQFVADLANDILKIVVVNRYTDRPVAKGFIKNFGLNQGALASSVAHDSHNIVAVGIDDESLCKAVNMIIAHKGGVSCIKENLEMIVPLPVAGLMSQEDGYKVAGQYSLIDQAAKEAGSKLGSPFMTLSFMALLVIPHLKLSDLGLFDGDRFALLP